MLRCAVSLPCFIAALLLSTTFLPAECWVGHDRPFNSTEPRDTSVLESQGDKTLTLTILDETDKPIPNARFSYFGHPKPHPAKTHRHYVQADENGRFTIRLKSNVVQNLLEIQVDHPGYAPYNATWEKPTTDPIPNEYAIKLEKAEAVGGTVLDDTGKPLAGADVEFCVHWRERSRTPQVCSYRQWIKTDENGRWSCNLIPPAMFPTNVHLHVMHKGFMNYEKETKLADMRPDADGSMKHRVVMDRGITVKGRVTDEDGKPVVGASVFGNYMSTREDLVSKTDENGEYTLPNWPESNTTYIGVWKEGKQSVLQNCIVIKAAPTTVDIVMKNAGTPLRVKIVDKDGKPVPGFMIAIERWGEHRLVNSILLAGTPAWAKTDADGLWTWNEAPENEVVFDMMKDRSLMDIRNVSMTAREKPYVFTAFPALKISGEIVDAETNEKIPEFKVYLGFGPVAGQLYWEYMANAGKDGFYSLAENYPRESFGVKIEAEGYEPGISRRIEPSEGKITVDFSLQKLSAEKQSQALHGTVLTPDGKPAAGAQVALSTLQRNHQPFIDGGRIRGGGDTLYLQKTDKDGKFRFPYIDFEEERKNVQYLPQGMKIVDYTLTLLHDTGFRQVGPDEMQSEFKDKPITLEKWGRIEGIAKVGTQPGAELRISFHPQFEQGDPPLYRPVPGWHFSATTDASGRFVFEQLPKSSGLVQQGVSFAQTGRGGMVRYSGGVKVEVRSGETVSVQLGGNGRPVMGKLVPEESIGGDVNWNFGVVSCRPPVEKFDFQVFAKLMEKLPKHVKDETDPEKRGKLADEWASTTEEGKAYREEFEALQAKQREWSKREQESRQQSRISAVAADGTFRLNDVTEDKWMLEVELNAAPEEGQWQGKLIGRLTHEFTMPAVPGGVSDEALDLGSLTVQNVEQPKPLLQIGESAPDFEIDRVFPASEGTEEKKDAKLKLSDFEGKYVILEFWATWCVPCVQKLSELKKLNDSIKDDPRFVLVGISFDNKNTKERLEKFLAEKEIDWPQGLAGNLLESSFPKDYGVSAIPALLLIGRDGKVLLNNPGFGVLQKTVDQLKTAN